MQRAKPETISKGLKKHLGTGPDGQRTEILISNCQSSDDPIAEKALVLMEWYVEKYINGELPDFIYWSDSFFVVLPFQKGSNNDYRPVAMHIL